MAVQRKEIGYVTHLRALACIAIVVLHTFYAAIAYTPDLTARTTALTVRNLMLWAVPCFVMVTGTLLLDAQRHVTYRKLFRKYIPRMVIALLAFSILFELLDAAMGGEKIRLVTLADGLKNAVLGQSWAHMWYLYLMIALYLLLPFYRKIAAALEKRDAYYLIGVFLVFLSLLPLLEAMIGTNTAFYICVYSVYPLYLFLGYAIAQKLVACPHWLWILLAVGATVAMGILTVFSTVFAWEKLAGQLTSYAFPLIVLQAAGIHGWMATAKAKMPGWLDWILRQIDNCSFGIYLIHMVFLKFVMVYWGWNPYVHGGTGMVVLVTIAVFLCSFAVVWLLKKIPGLKQLL